MRRTRAQAKATEADTRAAQKLARKRRTLERKRRCKELGIPYPPYGPWPGEEGWVPPGGKKEGEG